MSSKMLNRKLKTRTLYVLMFILSLFVVFSIIYYSKLLALKIMEYNNTTRAKKGRKVIVGHYVGKGKVDLPDEVINANNYDPQPGWGENGKPVIIPSKDMFKMQQLFQINQFNLMASDGMSLNRTLPDVRNNECKSLNYSVSKLPTTSVVIVFYNEAWSVLLRTVWSIINRSNHRLVKEILLVDDGSDRKYLLAPDLDDYVAKLPVKTRVLRLGTRKGLVSARLLGAKEATGDVLTFLDAHCECSEGWLEPLLTRIRENKRKVVCPVIDIISDDNFSYIKSAEFHWGAFNWHLHFRWYMIGDEEIARRKLNISAPYRTPAMAGGLFSIDREYFYEVGSYDEEMKIWGGDNIEMSLRIWQCGGEIEIAPCSHVGHLFRKSSPYTFPGGISDILDKNLIRVASVWMDEWAEMFYRFNKNAAALRDSVDVDSRVSLRRNMRCQSFEWYLRNVWKEHFFPTSDRLVGRIRMLDPKSVYLRNFRGVLNELQTNKSFTSLPEPAKLNASISHLNRNQDRIQMGLGRRPSFCIVRPKAASGSVKQPFGEVTIGPCSYGGDNVKEILILTPDGRIMSDDNTCLQAPEIKEDGRMKLFMKRAKKKVRMVQCNSANRHQRWRYSIESMHIKQNGTEFCLELDDVANKWFGHENDLQRDVNMLFVYLRNCDTSNPLQKWVFQPLPWQ